MEDVEHLRAAIADRYLIEAELGRGGMATIYLAEDVRHGRKVAVKVLRPEITAMLGPERFLREIEISARLTHPHILPLYDSGNAAGMLYYVMPFVEGESLRNRLDREGELPVTDAARILRDLVDALAHAHRCGVVHRDIKPDNVMLAARHAVVTDFGVAKAVSVSTGPQRITTAGIAVGTPQYMAPEQAAADPKVDPRSDIYSVGVVGYELLAGRPPFGALTAREILAAHVSVRPRPVTDHRDAVPEPLARMVMKCLEKRPADRWQSADELLVELEAFLAPSTSATPVRAPVPDTTAATIRSPRQQAFRLVAVLLAATPFGLALFRALRAGDFRFLWMALASLLGAVAVTTVGKAHRSTPRSVLALSALTFIVTSLFAAGVALLLGATARPPLVAVALAFGLCWSAGYAFNALSRPPSD